MASSGNSCDVQQNPTMSYGRRELGLVNVAKAGSGGLYLEWYYGERIESLPVDGNTLI